MTHGRGKSDSVIVAVKPTNKVVSHVAEQSAARSAAAEQVPTAGSISNPSTSAMYFGKLGAAPRRSHLPSNNRIMANEPERIARLRELGGAT